MCSPERTFYNLIPLTRCKKQSAPASPARGEAKGFTLAEVLVALFVFALVSVMLSTGLHSMLTGEAVTRRHTLSLSNLQMAYLHLDRDIRQAVDRPVREMDGSLAGLTGTAHSLTLVHGGMANPGGMLMRPTLQRVRYTFPRNQQLMREVWALPDQTARPGPGRILLPRISHPAFAYLDQAGTLHNRWPPEMKKTLPLPRAIRLTLDTPETGPLTQWYSIPGGSP